MNGKFSYWFINVVMRNLRIPRVTRLLLDWNPKEYEVAEHIDTKSKVNPWMISTFKMENPF